ncbi:MAG: bifunctional folylpolyglutamate synthase/dihydrofolate synthase [Kiritimatiellae bacterium]|nr:bifunctional folylpolyglutamate synthase/dihydrofolate synthase [Kiritimatiellia bacterium]
MDRPSRLERLYARRTFGIKPGLDSIRGLLRELGDPHGSFRVLHVAGTDGKGSVCAMLDSVLRAAGLRTGLYTSPHLVRLSERFRIGGAEIADDAFFPLLDEVEAAAARLVARGAPEPTFFETTTALCALWFAREGVKLAVAEVGMGGRLDATNVFLPALSVVTRIGMDHMQYLGGTLREIALEKAGIAKPGVPVVLGAMPDEARAAVLARAREIGAPAVLAEEACAVRRVSGDLRGQKFAVSTPDRDYGAVKMRLAASYQAENAATAVAAIETLGRVLGIEWPAKTVAAGLGAAELPGRFQLLSDDPATILDGGHNPCAAEALLAALKAAKAARGVRLVCGMCADKDPAGWLRALAPAVGKVWTVPLANPRGLPPEKLAAFARGAGLREVRACATLAEGLSLARDDARAAGRPVLVAGSLFLAGDVLSA